MVSEVNNSGSSIITAMDQRMVKLDKAQSSTAPQPGVALADAPAADTVQLTDTASRLRDLTQSIADIPVVDRQRVDAFQQSINDGSYRIDNQQVADKVIGFEAMMTGRPNQA